MGRVVIDDLHQHFCDGVTKYLGNAGMLRALDDADQWEARTDVADDFDSIFEYDDTTIVQARRKPRMVSIPLDVAKRIRSDVAGLIADEDWQTLCDATEEADA